MIKKVKEGYRVVAESGRNMGTYSISASACWRRKGGTYPLSHLYGHFGLVLLSRLGHDVSWVKA